MKHLLLIALAAAAFNVSAQSPCGSDYMNRKAISENPAAAAAYEKLQKLQAPAGSQRTVKVIPVVFHIIHSYGTENITDAQVFDAMRIINEDFRRMNADTTQIVQAFKGVAGDSRIEFRLAKLDPSGNCTNGITRTYSELTHTADDNVKELISWDNDKYLNIWVVDKISFSAGGYAYYPGTAPAGGEGIVVVHTQLGGAGTSCGSNFCERTLTHEVGHYFNLPHTWGGDTECGSDEACSDDDGVNDTPNTAGACQTCNLSQSTCGPLSNVQNYMDYSTCTVMFTEGQAARMDAALYSTIGGRWFLWQPSNLVATGTDNNASTAPCIPVADFTSSYKQVCTGSSIIFRDASWNAAPTGWLWEFPGGTPSTSTAQSPAVTYSAPGLYEVRLTVSTSAGSNTIVKPAYITVATSTASHSSPSFTESFESISVPGSDWKVENNTANSPSFTICNFAGSTGSSSLFIENQSNWDGEIDEVITPSINISMISNPQLRFDVAFASMDATDLLQVYASRDCGKNWILRYSKTGSALVTAPLQPGTFIPDASQWRNHRVSLAAFASETNMLFKFRYTNRTGNNLYIDDINIVNGTTAIEDIESAYAFSVFPNPANEAAHIRFALPSRQSAQVSIYNSLGQKVYFSEYELANGDHEIMVNTLQHGTGVYMAELRTEGVVLVKRMVVR